MPTLALTVQGPPTITFQGMDRGMVNDINRFPHGRGNAGQIFIGLPRGAETTV